MRHTRYSYCTRENVRSCNNSYICWYWVRLYKIASALASRQTCKMCRHYCVFLNRKKVTLKDLQSLIGLLNFACSVIVPGRAFLRRLIDLTQGMQKPRHFIRLRQAIKEDLKIWQTFLFSFNGISFFLDETWCNSNKLNLFTDASGSIGFGAIFGTPNGVMANGRCHRRFAPPRRFAPQESPSPVRVSKYACITNLVNQSTFIIF
jgi:hypothetical protein